jgi:hypothetical protein
LVRLQAIHAAVVKGEHGFWLNIAQRIQDCEFGPECLSRHLQKSNSNPIPAIAVTQPGATPHPNGAVTPSVDPLLKCCLYKALECGAASPGF